jgi:hypothetical protein
MRFSFQGIGDPVGITVGKARRNLSSVFHADCRFAAIRA